MARKSRSSGDYGRIVRSEEHTSELQSRLHLVCRLLLEKKKKNSFHTGQTGDRYFGLPARTSSSAGLPRPMSSSVVCLHELMLVTHHCQTTAARGTDIMP